MNVTSSSSVRIQEVSIEILKSRAGVGRRRRRRKRVSFQTTCPSIQHSLPGDTTTTTTSLEDIRSRWYSSEELQSSREDARLCLQALQAVQGRLECVDTSRYCLRGMEKFANVQAKIQTQRIHTDSILQQQSRSSTDRSSGVCPEQLAALSRYLTQPSREQAHRFALLCAQELVEEEEQAASALLSFSKGKEEESPGWMSPASAPTSSYQPPNPSVSPCLLLQQVPHRRPRSCLEPDKEELSRKKARHESSVPLPTTKLFPRQVAE
eukprot:CAMPEP_0176096610 /NCGR_PEP_ID=MMETSP0120_2-20121206/48432_1 /TAXON_ID=160619 /ORGANISM="Kryptoperidinium foliaceum, Strain CCMP 1326" /LENGTH=265 /DNA_ID=CAMNT_0017430597 /DNA_START=80 /DNA_END=877 /DNA_ORIENTATION=+